MSRRRGSSHPGNGTLKRIRLRSITPILTNEQVKKFQAIYRKSFGKEISKEAALEQGIKLVRLMEIIYKPMTKEEYEMIQKRRKETGRKMDESDGPNTY